jgi:hypothetical protein
MTHAADNSESMQNYIAGRLSETDRSAFEDRLLTDDGLVRDLEESLRLREGLEILRERQELGLQTPARRRTWASGVLRACAAAMVIIALYLGWHYVQRSPAIVAASVAALRTNTSTPLTVVERHAFATLREATQIPTLPLPTSGALELRALTPVSGPARAFRVTLELNRNDGKVSRIGVAERLAPDADGFVVIYADASKLQPGDYSLLVEPDVEHPESLERFAFRLTRVAETTR